MQLAADPLVTWQDIDAHWQAIDAKDKTLAQKHGLLVTVLRNRDPPPTPPPKPGSQEDRQRYITGEYAEYIDR